MTKEEVFSFPSADGRTTVHAVRWTPEDGKYRAVLQITHGMVEYIERYRAFAEFLNDNGFLVVGHDHIGHGESVVSKDEWGFFAEHPSDTVVADMHTLREITRKEHPGVPYFMLGHSMGSYMLRKYLAFRTIPQSLPCLLQSCRQLFWAGITEVNYYRNYLMINTIISLI